MNEELKQFNINIEDIEENNNLFNNIQEAIDKLRKYTLKDRFEVVLNNNLIESKEKLTNYRTILGCRISYDNLDKNISFIVREDEKPTYEELQQQLDKYKNVIDKIKEILNNMKPLSLVETSIKEELKSAYNPKESAIKGTDEYFDTVCHLEDFEVQIWNIKELLEEVE